MFGNGAYERQMNYGIETHLHNDWLQLIYELGIVGLIPMAVLLAVPSAFAAALVVIGCFGFPLHMPASAALSAFVVGHDIRNLAAERRGVLRTRLAPA